ncbi:MAG: hypothetical protein II868_07700 [Butyrivibrio sp.]|nr:hypothetical protein [Butyrivibrio sp.]
MKSTGLRIALFILSVTLLLGLTTHVMRKKTDEEVRFQNLRNLENGTLDVLILGSSHAHCSFYTDVFWTEYGISSFVLGGNRQTLWDSYYALCDALETHRPKLIILEPFGVCLTAEQEGGMFAYGNTYALRLSENKIDAIRTAAPEDDFFSFLTVYPLFHTRYNDLTREDFVFRNPKPESKGTTFHKSQTPYAPPVIPADALPAPVPEKAETYYRRIIELVQKEEIPLLIVAAPFQHTDLQYCQLLTARDIAKEYGVPFLNANDVYATIGIDYATCFADETHLNFVGGPVFTKYVAGYVHHQYDLLDHRGDAAYASWDADAAVMKRRQYNCAQQGGVDLAPILDRFRDPSYLIILSFSGQSHDAEAGLRNHLRGLHLEETGAGGIRVLCGEETLRVCLPGEEAYLSTGGYDFYFKSETDAETDGVVNTVLLDHVPVPETPEQNGMTVTVYDLLFREVVTSVVTWKDNDYNGFAWTK